MDLSRAQWRISSYSGPQGGNCIEVAHVPTDWRTSSYSGGQGGECVEVTPLPSAHATHAVRDSKSPELGHLPFPSAEWSSFLSGLKRGEFE